MYQTIVWEVREHTGLITLNRPERLNAIDNVMRQELEDVLRRAEVDRDVWTLVVTGNGRGFCSGADLKARAEAEKRGEAAAHPPPAAARAAVLLRHRVQRTDEAGDRGGERRHPRRRLQHGVGGRFPDRERARGFRR
jgi:enoyl-CoA hydratase/carnithine racemase